MSELTPIAAAVQAHSDKIGGSTAKRTIKCPRWRYHSYGIPTTESGAAAMGSCLHAAIHMYLEEGVETLNDLVGFQSHGCTVTVEHVAEKLGPCLDFLDWVEDTYGDYGMLAEAEVHFGEALPGCFGSCDLLLRIDKTGMVIAVDWKFGDGVPVSAIDNDQGKFYALAASIDPKTRFLFEQCEEVAVAIVQPSSRLADDQVPWEVWHTSMDELERFLPTLQHALAESENPHAHMEKGDWCQFCPAKPVCPQWLAAARAIPLEQATHDISGEKVAELLQLAEDVDNWTSSLRKFAEESMHKNVDVPGWKVVAKQGRRRWIDETAAMAFLRSKRIPLKNITSPKLMSPTQVSKVVPKKKWKAFEELLVTKKSSGTTIAPESDKRPDMRLAISLAKAADIKPFGEA